MTQAIVTTDALKTVLSAMPLEPTDVTIVSKTVPAMRKTGNPFVGNLFKVSTVSAVMNWHYATEVNKQRKREGGLQVVDGLPVIAQVEEFEAKPRKWGTRLPNSPFVHHINKQGEEKWYLELKVSESHGHEYRDAENNLVDGKKLERAKTFFSKRSTSSRQGVKSEIILRDYGLENVVAITFVDNGTMLIVDNTQTAAAEISEVA